MAQEIQTTRKRVLSRKAALTAERQSWLSHWRDIAEYQLPRAGRFLSSDRNKGDKRNDKINDNTGIFALRTLAAGMMAGMTSPARPWFRLSFRDKEILKVPGVNRWLYDSAALMRAIFAQSNTYRTLHGMYEELGAFGTAAAFVLPDFNDVIRMYPMTIGEYSLGTNYRGEVDTLVREFEMTVGQIVEEFGIENVSFNVKNMWDTNRFDQWVKLIHLVEPNRNRDTSLKDAKGKKFSSTYIEAGSDNDDKPLRLSGFNKFPLLTPRWTVTGNDIYGRSPGMECLGDVQQLQHQQLRKAQGIDYQVLPPLQVPSAYKEFSKARLPGGVFFVDSPGPGQGVRSAFEVNLNLDHLRADIMDIRERIKSAYYADLFLMLANDNRSGITATEVAERHEEKMLMLGPVLERLHNEMLSPLIEITFERCAESGILPEPPEQLQGMTFEVEFISTLSQAQKAVSAGAIDQVLTRIGNLAGAAPQALDKIDGDKIVDEWVDMFGVNPSLFRNDDETTAIRQQREQAAKMQQLAQAAAPAAQAAQAAKTASDIDPESLDNISNLFQGYMGST